MSGCGYKQKCNRPLSYTRYTPNSRRRRGQVPLSLFTSAMAPGAGGQDGGAVRPRLSSHAEDSHLRVLPEPYVNLSAHTAPDVRPFP